MKTLAASIVFSLAFAALPRPAFAWPGDDGDIAFDVIAGNWQPWRIDPEGTMPTRFSLSGSGSKAPLRWSPDGQQITYQEYISGQGSRIWVGAANGLRMPLDIPARPDRNGYDTTPYSPSWHPDGRHIVYDQAGNIYLRNLDTGADTQLTFDGSVGSIPARPTIEGVAYDYAEVSPDGQKVVLMYTRWARLENGSFDAPQDVAVIPITGLAAGAIPELITDDRLIEYVPRWSPNGSEILFAKRLQIEGEDRRELVVRAYGPGGNSRVVFSNTYDPGYGAWGMSAAWSPTGQRIVFNARNQGGSGVGGSLFVIDAQGGEPRVLYTQPSAPGNNWFPYRPDWQPLPPRLRIEREVEVDDESGTMRYTLTVHNESEVEIAGGRLVESISPAYNVQRPVNVMPTAELEWADDTGRITWALDPIPPSKSIELRYELAANWVRVEQAGLLAGVSGWPRASWTTPPNEPSPSSGPAAPTIELDGDPVVVSNSPENIPIGLDDGVMYRQNGFTVQGRFRTFNYKVLYPPRASAPVTTKNFYHVLYNPGSEAVEVRRLASGVSVLPRVQALESGKEALAQYMSARAAPPAPTAVSIPGGAARALPIASVTTAAGTSVVYTGFDDFIAGGELEYAEVMIDSSDAAAFEADPSGFSLRSSSKTYRETDPPPYEHYRRGTYRHGARTITVPALDDVPAKRYSLRLGGDETQALPNEYGGVDEQLDSQDLGVLEGSYAVLQTVRVPAQNASADRPLQILVNPRAGGFIGRMEIDGQLVDIPQVTDVDTAAGIALIDRAQPFFEFSFMLTGGAGSPNAFIVAPAYVDTEAELRWTEGGPVTKRTSQPLPQRASLPPPEEDAGVPMPTIDAGTSNPDAGVSMTPPPPLPDSGGCASVSPAGGAPWVGLLLVAIAMTGAYRRRRRW